ncbi:MAG: SurA N-terminal domain-containing protein, partial [Thermodesulfobacteriota bacterium]
MKIITLIFTLLLLLSISDGLHAAVVVDKIAAVVNNEIITLSELEKATEKTNELSEQKVDKRFVLERLIDEIVLNQEASKRGVKISEEELDSIIEQLKSQVESQGKNMEEELAKENVSMEELREKWRLQMLTKRLVDTEIQGKIAVTEDEILDYYRSNYGEVEFGSQIRIAHIL